MSRYKKYFIPVQVMLSDCSWYPVLHKHSYDPGVFLHTWEHLSVFNLHSSISKISIISRYSTELNIIISTQWVDTRSILYLCKFFYLTVVGIQCHKSIDMILVYSCTPENIRLTSTYIRRYLKSTWHYVIQPKPTSLVHNESIQEIFYTCASYFIWL